MRAAKARSAAGFVSQPEPRTIGSFARGRQLLAGNFLFAGHLVNAPDHMLWDIKPPNPAFIEETQGFAWLDDLASVGDHEARSRAQDWVFGWIDAYGNGRGEGWTPDLTGRRLIRWISHALFLMGGMTSEQSERFFRSLGQQTLFLARRWGGATPGLPRFEALTGLIYAGFSLTGVKVRVDAAIRALAQECVEQIDKQGGIPTRNPEELLEVFTLLNWAALTLREVGREPEPEHLEAINRIAPTLRALRHSDGSLARFHGGGRGLDGRLDHALANSGVRATANEDLSMGYARLSAGRTSVIIDGAPPPVGNASANGHASTLAFELTSGRRPVIVNCGSGLQFGQEWHKAGRATPSHSVLGLSGQSSSRLSQPMVLDGIERTFLVQTPKQVPLQYVVGTGTTGIVAAHDGYIGSHGLTHMRKLELAVSGRELSGEDTLTAVSEADQQKFDTMLDETSLQGVPYSVRFHLHPEVDATLDMGGTAVSLALRSGEIWVFRFEGRGELALESSVYLEKTRLKPRKTKQVVLSGVAMDYATRIRWTLAKAQDTPTVLRDLETGDRAELPD
ncbi:heparinase II/III family protein [Aliiroseovarius sp. F20344]|uniref:heparinase II/III family protein n=1 Tax=Aliiroseovarius sp. F20344 TaxID=2926414 RepID=UPI001FF22D20|nr:heparinase II/III family protein [Aliiroseovarius sp. F20344]MCK0141565.1 heparinase II/III family protein [Aliiroseovarius sp. F20344]